MPQLVKGGKYIFGWTRINRDHKIRIPDEAFDEYNFSEREKLIIISGSRSSGGFSIITPNSILSSKLSENITRSVGYHKETNTFTPDSPETVKQGARVISRTSIDNRKCFIISYEFLSLLEINAGDRLLVGRGSGLGPAFIAKGVIYNEALKHDLPEYG